MDQIEAQPVAIRLAAYEKKILIINKKFTPKEKYQKKLDAIQIEKAQIENPFSLIARNLAPH